MNDELLDLLAYELGKIHRWEEECPGVYYLAVLPDDMNAEEYYVVFAEAPISQEARAMGRPLKTVQPWFTCWIQRMGRGPQ